MVGFVVSLSNGMVAMILMLLGYKDDLRHLDHSLLDWYMSPHSLKLSSFQPEGNDRTCSKPISRPR